MDLWILDDSLRISIFYDQEACGFSDNICVSIYESCPYEEKVLIADETNIFLNRDEAERLANMLLTAIQQSNHSANDD